MTQVQSTTFTLAMRRTAVFSPRLHVLETVTDAAGQYEFPAWGPKLNPRYPLTTLDYDPDLTFFMRGYQPRFLSNQRASSAQFASRTGTARPSRSRFAGSDDDWVQSPHKIQAYVSWGHHMDWRLIPRTTLAPEQERRRLERSPGLTPGLNISGLNELGVTLTDLQRFLEEQR